MLEYPIQNGCRSRHLSSRLQQPLLTGALGHPRLCRDVSVEMHLHCGPSLLQSGGTMAHTRFGVVFSNRYRLSISPSPFWNTRDMNGVTEMKWSYRVISPPSQSIELS
jgi:hypothetical protein